MRGKRFLFKGVFQGPDSSIEWGNETPNLLFTEITNPNGDIVSPAHWIKMNSEIKKLNLTGGERVEFEARVDLSPFDYTFYKVSKVRLIES